MELIEKILNKSGILYEDHSTNGVLFRLPGDFMYREMPPLCYEIAFKYEMRRSRNSYGFVSCDFALEAAYSRYEFTTKVYTTFIFRRRKA